MTRVFDEDLDSAFGTRAIHAGQRPEPLAGAIMTPLYLTSTYVQEAIGKNKGYEYARGKNPTREALERNVAALEGGRHGFAFASGMGCTDSIMKLFRAGDHIVCGENVYGGTSRLFDRILVNLGLRFTYVDTRYPDQVADAVTPQTRAILVETPTNPMMWIADLAAMKEIAGRAEAYLIVDNTFATPYFQRPLEFGAEIVYHSATKYLNGHSDMIGGIAVVRDDSLAERLSLQGNPALKADWATLPGGEAVDFLTFARTEGRFAGHFAPDGTPTPEIEATRDDRLWNWRSLQELGGIR